MVDTETAAIEQLRDLAETRPGQTWAVDFLVRELARLGAEKAELLAALEQIANGDGYYGAQAREYKEIARAAIAKARGAAT